MITKWLSTIEACQVLEISQSTLRRRIDKDEVESKMEDGRRLVLVTTDNQEVTTEELDTSADNRINKLTEEKILLEQELRGAEKKAALVDGLMTDKEQLQQQLTEKDRQIENLQIQLQDASQRHDTVVMQMSKMLEYERMPFWRRWRRQKAFPPPENIIDNAGPDITQVDNPDDNDSGNAGGKPDNG